MIRICPAKKAQQAFGFFFENYLNNPRISTTFSRGPASLFSEFFSKKLAFLKGLTHPSGPLKICDFFWINSSENFLENWFFYKKERNDKPNWPFCQGV